MKKIVRTVCQGCHCECGVLVHVEDGTISKIEGDPEHPSNRGFICIKGVTYSEVVYHPDRLKYPLKRVGKRGEGRWKKISWNEALDGIAKKFTEVREKYGSESIATIHGTGPRPSIVSTTLLAYALHSPNVISVDLHICYAPSVIAEYATVGRSVTMEVGPDYEFTNCIVVWGANPVVSHPPKGKEILEAKSKRGAKLIVVDPRRTLLAYKADLWLQIRPGTDCALALGMMNVIIEEGLYDKEFVDKWCYGFDKLKEQVREYTPEKVSEITWIPADRIREAARLYATTKPATLHHRVAIEHNINSVQTDRALIILVALTGNIDVKGGNLLPVYPEGYVRTYDLLSRMFRPPQAIEEKRIGNREFPLTSGPGAPIPFVPAPLALYALLTGNPYPIKALYCAGGNPVVNMQDSKKVWNALKDLELLVVADFFMTPTAELADYVLPVTTWLERNECCDDFYTNYVSARQKVIDPLFECWDDMKIVIELVKKIPWADRRFLPWNSVNEFNNWRVKGTGITFGALKKKGTIITPMQYAKFKKKGFDTPSRKVELYSTLFEKYGYDPLPKYKEPPESPYSTPELYKEYPFILITGGRQVEYFHSEGRQILQLRKRVPDPEVEIHPDTAKTIGIKDGEWVCIETPRIKDERVKFKAKLTPDIHPKVIHARHGWWFPEEPVPEHGCFKSNINVILSNDPPRDEICCSVPTRGTLCRVYVVCLSKVT
jgi:anaerobic selenocysteine-containing dehydrogenase